MKNHRDARMLTAVLRGASGAQQGSTLNYLRAATAGAGRGAKRLPNGIGPAELGQPQAAAHAKMSSAMLSHG